MLENTARAGSITLSAAIIASFAMLGIRDVTAATGAARREQHPLRVTSMAGDVAVTVRGERARVEVDSTLDLPARIVTGEDGTIGLGQGKTTIAVAPNSDVEVPAEAVDGQLIARLVQHRGNVFYDVAHRDVGKLRVETPFLVAVIKGTQFNVAVLEDSTAISLFQGQLEIRSPDGSDLIQLNAGEIAIRSLVDSSIRVLDMNGDSPVARAAAPADRAASSAPRADSSSAASAAGLPRVDTARNDPNAKVEVPAKLEVAANVAADRAGLGATAAAGVREATNDLDLGVSVAPSEANGTEVRVAVSSAESAIELGKNTVSLGLDTNVRADTVDVGAGASLGGAADVGLAGNLDLSTKAPSLGSGAGVGVTVGASTSLDLGAASTPPVGATTGLDLGATAAPDVGAAATPTLGTPSLDLGTTTPSIGGANTGGLALDVGPTIGGSGTGLGVGATLGGASLGVDLNASLDLSLGGSSAPTGTGTGASGTIAAPAAPPAPPPPAAPAPPPLLGRVLGPLL
ncbi:MAG TPA: FecR domain-containing protein [Gammaproteobacteria bacterium]|nr:FecR domain-containing protein [Gammaproteobacteria bacterium]